MQGETREEAVYKMADEMLKKLPRWVVSTCIYTIGSWPLLLCVTGCWNRDNFWIIYNTINAYIRDYIKYWQICSVDTFYIFFWLCFGSLTCTAAPLFNCGERRNYNYNGAQRLHAARGEVRNEPHGWAHAHEHLPQTGDRQDAEGTHIIHPVLLKNWIVSRDEYFLKGCNNLYVLSVHALTVFTIFCS